MIYLYGYLSKRFKKTTDCVVHSVEEMMRAMEANNPGFRNAIYKKREYIVVRGDTLKKGKSVATEEVNMRFSENDWHILPIPMGYGGKSGGFISIILGVVLIVAGVYISGMSFGGAAPLGGIMIKAGIGLMIGGIAMLLAPAPPTFDYGDSETPDERPSYLFDGPTNSVEPGLTIPLAYGETFIGSIFVSGGLEIVDIPI